MVFQQSELAKRPERYRGTRGSSGGTAADEFERKEHSRTTHKDAVPRRGSKQSPSGQRHDAGMGWVSSRWSRRGRVEVGVSQQEAKSSISIKVL